MNTTKDWSKFVRDRTPFILMEEGKQPAFKILSIEDYGGAIFEKMFVEMKEYQASKNTVEATDNLIDIYEVLLCTLPYLGLTENEFHDLVLEKRKRLGSFQEGIILEEVQEKASSSKKYKSRNNRINPRFCGLATVTRCTAST